MFSSKLSSNKKFIKHSFFSFAVILLNIFTSVFAVRENLSILQKDLYGVWILAFGTIGLFGLLNFGFNSIIIFRFNEAKSESSKTRLFSNNLLIILIQSLVTFIATFAIYNTSNLIISNPIYADKFNSLLIFLIPGIFFNIISTYFESVLYYNLKFIYHKNILEFLRISFLNILLVVSLYYSKDINLMPICFSAVSLMTLVYNIYKFKSVSGISASLKMSDFNYIKSNYRDAFSFWVSGISAFAITQTDVFFISSYQADIGLVTLYSQSFRLQEIALRFLKKLTEIKGPKILSLINSNNQKAIVSIYTNLLVINILLSCLAITFIQFFGKKILEIWLKNEIQFDQTLLGVLSLICLTSSVHWVLWNFCNLVGYQNRIRNIVILEVVLNIVLSYVLIRHIGLIGLGIASIASNIVTISFELHLFLRYRKIHQ